MQMINNHIYPRTIDGKKFNRVFTKHKRFTKKKKLTKDTSYPELHIHGLLSKYSFLDKDRVCQIHMNDSIIYVTAKNRSTGNRDTVLKFNRRTGAYIGQVGLPAPGLHDFGIMTVNDKLFIIGGVVPTEPGYRKNFLETPEGWQRLNNNLSEGRVKRIYYNKKEGKFVYRCSNRIYVIDVNTLKGQGTVISQWEDDPYYYNGDTLGIWGDHIWVWIKDQANGVLRIAPRGYKNGAFYNSTARKRVEIPLEECGNLHMITLCEANRIAILAQKGIFHVNTVEGTRWRSDERPIGGDYTHIDNIGEGVCLITTSQKISASLLCAYSGEQKQLSSEFAKAVNVNHQCTAFVTDHGITFKKLTDLDNEGTA